MIPNRLLVLIFLLFVPAAAALDKELTLQPPASKDYIEERLKMVRTQIAAPSDGRKPITDKKVLEALGFEVEEIGDTTLKFYYKGRQVLFFPYSGWHTGSTIIDGRGFNKLLNQIKNE